MTVVRRKRSGRRPGSPDTRAEILAAARDAFARDGFERSSIRRIANDAGVDPALVHHYFGTKDQLFLAAIEAPFDPMEVLPKVLAGGEDQLGENLIRFFLSIWDSPTGNRAAAFLRSAITRPEMSHLVRQFITTQIVRRGLKLKFPELDHAELRGALVASQLLGMAVTRHIFGIEALTRLTVDELAAIYGPTVQRYITMDFAELRNQDAD
ncbi:MAG TPA: TetR family transcriptional regulator [Stackebrandtia sp.]|uniref:TetR/AcrR family transcriptional regulator n=1 Tax=Stackebrandtia sp. TaxID=2023065 RepID=UPI002D50D9EC|nr:TetR family transcriptional regulator [Stackebrandtia sp.]HZE39556.1 TetR family transcriptional regulator [Stackebrandtia sp.]